MALLGFLLGQFAGGMKGKPNPSSPSKAAPTCQAGAWGEVSGAVDAEMTV